VRRLVLTQARLDRLRMSLQAAPEFWPPTARHLLHHQQRLPLDGGLRFLQPLHQPIGHLIARAQVAVRDLGQLREHVALWRGRGGGGEGLVSKPILDRAPGAGCQPAWTLRIRPTPRLTGGGLSSLAVALFRRASISSDGSLRATREGTTQAMSIGAVSTRQQMHQPAVIAVERTEAPLNALNACTNPRKETKRNRPNNGTVTRAESRGMRWQYQRGSWSTRCVNRQRDRALALRHRWGAALAMY